MLLHCLQRHQPGLLRARAALLLRRMTEVRATLAPRDEVERHATPAALLARLRAPAPCGRAYARACARACRRLLHLRRCLKLLRRLRWVPCALHRRRLPQRRSPRRRRRRTGPSALLHRLQLDLLIAVCAEAATDAVAGTTRAARITTVAAFACTAAAGLRQATRRRHCSSGCSRRSGMLHSSSSSSSSGSRRSSSSSGSRRSSSRSAAAQVRPLGGPLKAPRPARSRNRLHAVPVARGRVDRPLQPRRLPHKGDELVGLDLVLEASKVRQPPSPAHPQRRLRGR